MRQSAFRTVPPLALDPNPGDDDPSSSSSSDGEREDEHDPFGDPARRKRDKKRKTRKSSAEPQGRGASVPTIPRFERLETPALSTRAVQRYDAPDPPGMGGMHFQDEKPHWIALMDALDKINGINAEDAVFRSAKSQATANIRRIMAENANTVIGKGLLAQNHVKVDHNHIPRYDGTRGVRDLERYVTQFLDHFEMTNMLSPEEGMEKHRILMFGSRLAGAAHEFWIRNISGRASSWTLIDVVQALEAQFIPMTLYETAKEQFDRFRQKTGESVQSAYLRLQEYSESMMYEASPYEMKYRFFHGVRDEIRGQLAHDDCSPEKGRWALRDMVKMAINIEEGIEKSKPRSSRAQAYNDRVSTNKPNYADERKKRHNSPRPGDRHQKHDRRHRERDNNDGKRKEPVGDHHKPTNQVDRKPNSGIPRPKGRYVVNKDVSKDQCLKCHKRGHWAQDCPMVYRGNAVIDPSAATGRELTEAALNEHSEAAESVNLKAMEINTNPNPAADDSNESYDGNGPPTNYSSINYALSSSAITICEPDDITKYDCRVQGVGVPNPDKILHRNRVFTSDGRMNRFANVNCESISGYIPIGKLRAHVLIDTGSEVQMMSANYAKTADIPILPLDRPIGLRLATVGHKSTITHGCEAEMVVGQNKILTYWDIGRVDHYDAILGIQALRSLGCIIDTNRNRVSLPDGTPLIKEEDIIRPLKPSGPVKRKLKLRSPGNEKHVALQIPEEDDPIGNESISGSSASVESDQQ
jgi:hypothetical protein